MLTGVIDGPIIGNKNFVKNTLIRKEVSPSCNLERIKVCHTLQVITSVEFSFKKCPTLMGQTTRQSERTGSCVTAELDSAIVKIEPFVYEPMNSAASGFIVTTKLGSIHKLGLTDPNLS